MVDAREEGLKIILCLETHLVVLAQIPDEVGVVREYRIRFS